MAAPNDASVVRVFTNEVGKAFADTVLPVNADFEVTLEGEAGSALLSGGTNFETNIVVQDITANNNIAANPAAGFSGDIGTAAWPNANQKFTFTVPKANLTGRENHVCQVLAWLAVGLNNMGPRDRQHGRRRRPAQAGGREAPLGPLVSVPSRLEAGRPFTIRVRLRLDGSEPPLVPGMASWFDVQVQACRLGSPVTIPLARTRVSASADRPARTLELAAGELAAGRYRLATLVTLGGTGDVAAFSDGPVVTVDGREPG